MWSQLILSEGRTHPLRAGSFIDQHLAVKRNAGEQFKQVTIAHAHATVGERDAHGLVIRRPVQVDVATEGIDPT